MTVCCAALTRTCSRPQTTRITYQQHYHSTYHTCFTLHASHCMLHILTAIITAAIAAALSQHIHASHFHIITAHTCFTFWHFHSTYMLHIFTHYCCDHCSMVHILTFSQHIHASHFHIITAHTCFTFWHFHSTNMLHILTHYCYNQYRRRQENFFGIPKSSDV